MKSGSNNKNSKMSPEWTYANSGTTNNHKGNSMTKEKESITMRTPFPAHQISKLPKPTKAQTDEVRADYTKGIRCTICGGWHHAKVVHIDYVGHAALTDRLLDVDANWTWEPVAMDALGLPAIDKDGGLWIRLTVNGITRLGYGDAQGKTGGDAMKERIGDALRNAAMRFGAALDLWHKGDLHIEDDAQEKPAAKPAAKPHPSKNFDAEIAKLKACTTMDALASVWNSLEAGAKHVLLDVKDAQKQIIDEGAAA